jgi:hypothetical protein
MSSAEPEIRSAAIPSGILLGAYLAHLLVPLVFLLDSVRAVQMGSGGVCEKAVIVAGSIWVLTGLGALAFSRNRRHFLDRVSRLLLGVYTLYFCVCFVGFGVDIWIRHGGSSVPFRYKPGSKVVMDHTGWHCIGVSPIITYSVNELGLRGPSPPREGQVYRIIAVGGTTTECGDLDDSQEWPHLVMEIMNDRQRQRFVWVGNAGASGLTTVHHLYCLRRRFVISQADLLLFLGGVDDLQATLDFGGESTQNLLEYRAECFTGHHPYWVDPQAGFFRRTWLFELGRESLVNLGAIGGRVRDSLAHKAGPRLFGRGKSRTPLVPLPNLHIGLQEYAQRVRNLEHECHARGLRCVFLTQPALWRADLSPDDQRLLWMGWVGWRAHRRGYASAADLARAMDAYNQTLLSVCGEDHLECYDLASFIPKDTSAFYDDCHFNIGGARMAAQFLAAHLLSSPPFR